MKKTITLIIVLAMALKVSAQTDVKLTFNHLLGSSPFALNSEAENDLGHKFKLSRLEYYISGISITHDGGAVTDASDIYILVNANVTDTINIGNFNIANVESISFSVGVDPGVNNGDPATWASSHPLAPKAPSMHWGWSSGYRFVALEGKSGNNFGQDFQIHALGNKNYFKQNIPVEATDLNSALLITLNADYTKAVSGMNINSGLVDHSAGQEPANCLRYFQTKVFSSLTGEGNTLSAKAIDLPNGISINPVPSNEDITLVLNDHRFNDGYVVITDISGREIYTNTIQSSKTFSIKSKGLYFLTAYGDGVKSSKKIIIN